MDNYSTSYPKGKIETRNISENKQLRHYLNSTLNTENLKHAAIDIYHSNIEANNINLSLAKSLEMSTIELTNNSYPILYQRKPIGNIHFPKQEELKADVIDLLPALTKKIAWVVKRYETRELSEHYLGKDLSLAGYSEQVLKLEAFIEKAASSQCPAIIHAEFGCEKLSVACAIHYNSEIRHKPFIEVICSSTNTEEFQQKLILSFQEAKGGTVFLHGVDELTCSQQCLLIEILAAKTEHEPSGVPIKNAPKVRLIVSTTKPLSALVENGTFSRQLYTELNFLNTTIPPLKDRKDDIPYILEKMLDKYHSFQEQCLSTEVKEALYNYHWPENHAELERIVAKLLVLANSNPINLIDLRKYSPETLNRTAETCSDGIITSNNNHKHFDLITSLLTKSYEDISHLHPGLQKALKYLAEHYCNEITLASLSSNACLSSSHLSYLFKLYVKKSFKQILAELRIEKAKKILASSPHSRITDVSFDVGFGDLSHFEKIFKRHTKITPREYQNRHRVNN
ncbi:helix-turn-helix domain-containing protein [Photobacterium lipolyticum]|uniref:AraC family transcriptional regulator n=1 Tax=Photobacterium lipolyticum TaxID=266810 RepID=A0A2T3MUS6_9GAMM|nr:helix-turn-helix domain-containing protein [Photobacterium lipolyticum]PSW03704.1 hypothetical protein C9I89_16345 [Photobacterium lipolyticum]